MIKIYHNNRCSKSRCALKYITESQQEIQVIDYLKKGLTKEEIVEILELLKVEPLAIIRTNEEIFKTQYKGKNLTKTQWIEALIAYPILLERPIAVANGKAVLGRPPELVKDLF
jgi:arsenate reductase